MRDPNELLYGACFSKRFRWCVAAFNPRPSVGDSLDRDYVTASVGLWSPSQSRPLSGRLEARRPTRPFARRPAGIAALHRPRGDRLRPDLDPDERLAGELTDSLVAAFEAGTHACSSRPGG